MIEALFSHDTQKYKDAAAKLKRFTLEQKLSRGFKKHKYSMNHMMDAFRYATEAVKAFGKRLDEIRLPSGGYPCRHVLRGINDSEILIHQSNINPEFSGCIKFEDVVDCLLQPLLKRETENERIVRESVEEVRLRLFPQNIPLSCHLGNHFSYKSGKDEVCFYCKNLVV